MSDLKEIQNSNIFKVCKVALGAANLLESDFVVYTEDKERKAQSLDINGVLLLPDTMLPVISITANAFAVNLLDSRLNNDDTVFAYDVIKDSSETLCYAKIVKNNEKEKDFVMQCLLTTEVMKQTFIPDENNRIDLTPIIKNWREFLSTYKDNRVIDPREVYQNLIEFNLSQRQMKPKVKYN